MSADDDKARQRELARQAEKTKRLAEEREDRAKRKVNEGERDERY